MYVRIRGADFSAAETRRLYMYFQSETVRLRQACKLLVVSRGHQFCCPPTWSRATVFDRFHRIPSAGSFPYFLARSAPVCLSLIHI